MTRTNRQLQRVDRDLPSRFGQICLVLVAFAGCATDPAEPICEARVLRISSVAVPQSFATSVEHGLDLDGDKVVDNHLGEVASTFHDYLGIDPNEAANSQLASNLVWQVGVSTCDDGTARLDRGSAMPVGALFDPSAALGAGFVESTSVAAIEVAQLAGGGWTGRIGMGLPAEGVADVVVPPIVAQLNAQHLFFATFDNAPMDGEISVEEVKNSPLAKTLLFAPDLGDRGEDGISFGVAFTAIEQPAN